MSMSVESPWCWQKPVAGRSGESKGGREQPNGPPISSGSPAPQGTRQVTPAMKAFLDLSLSVSLPSSFLFPLLLPLALPPSVSLCVPIPLVIAQILTPCLSFSPSLSPVATVNDLACRGLDKLEEKLPFLQQPSEMVQHQTMGTCRGWKWEEGGLPPPKPGLNTSASWTLGPNQALVNSKKKKKNQPD